MTMLLKSIEGKSWVTHMESSWTFFPPKPTWEGLGAPLSNSQAIRLVGRCENLSMWPHSDGDYPGDPADARGPPRLDPAYLGDHVVPRIQLGLAACKIRPLTSCTISPALFSALDQQLLIHSSIVRCQQFPSVWDSSNQCGHCYL